MQQWLRQHVIDMLIFLGCVILSFVAGRLSAPQHIVFVSQTPFVTINPTVVPWLSPTPFKECDFNFSAPVVVRSGALNNPYVYTISSFAALGNIDVTIKMYPATVILAGGDEVSITADAKAKAAGKASFPDTRQHQVGTKIFVRYYDLGTVSDPRLQFTAHVHIVHGWIAFTSEDKQGGQLNSAWIAQWAFKNVFGPQFQFTHMYGLWNIPTCFYPTVTDIHP